MNGCYINSTMASVGISPLLFHALNGVIFDRPLIDDVESHPVKAAHSGSAVHCWAPMDMLISLILRI